MKFICCGTFKFNDGSWYNGEFKEKSINDYGEYTWNDGRWYEGEWRYNKTDDAVLGVIKNSFNNYIIQISISIYWK